MSFNQYDLEIDENAYWQSITEDRKKIKGHCDRCGRFTSIKTGARLVDEWYDNETGFSEPSFLFCPKCKSGL